MKMMMIVKLIFLMVISDMNKEYIGDYNNIERDDEDEDI